LKAGKKDNSPFNIVKDGEAVHPRAVIRKGKERNSPRKDGAFLVLSL
jgi:hypothetical protein